MANHNVCVGGVSIATTVIDSSFVLSHCLPELKSGYSIIGSAKSVVGLDVEWRQSPNTSNKVAILQLCVGTRCLIIQPLHLDSIPQSLKNFLADKDTYFVGVGIEEDVAKLRMDWGLECGTGRVRELGELAARVLQKPHLRGCGLVELAREVVGLQIKKPASVTTSDWSAKSLTAEQIEYAAVDAYASYLVGNKLLNMN